MKLAGEMGAMLVDNTQTLEAEKEDARVARVCVCICVCRRVCCAFVSVSLCEYVVLMRVRVSQLNKQLDERTHELAEKSAQMQTITQKLVGFCDALTFCWFLSISLFFCCFLLFFFRVVIFIVVCDGNLTSCVQFASFTFASLLVAALYVASCVRPFAVVRCIVFDSIRSCWYF